MRVDYFKNRLATMPTPRSNEVFYYLDRIRLGAVKKQIETLRLELDNDKKKLIKNELAAVTFAGTFIKRGKNDLKKASGLLILDFDNVNIFETKQLLINIKECFSCWISPSGTGIKALFKIKIVENGEEYTHIYNEFVKHYNLNVDASGKDISRLCYESYDPDLYLNQEAEIFECQEIFYTNDNIGQITNIPIIDSNEIANRLMKWFKSKFNNKERNSSLYKLAIGFNDFGIDQQTAFRYLYYFEQPDFNKKEIDNIIRSAYKHTSNFNTKHFEDNIKIKQIETSILKGKKDTEIIKEFSDIQPENLKTEIKIIRDSIKIDEFWRLNKQGKLEIIPFRFKLYIENLQYFKYYPNEKSKTFLFIKKFDRFVDILTEFQIKDDILTRLIANQKIDAFDCVADQTRVFSNNYLSMIDTASITIKKDTQDFAMLYYQNLAVKVFKDKIEKIDYSDFTDFVWKNTVIERDFVDVDHHESQFRSFIWYVSGESVEKYNTLKSVIGYLLHSHKTSSNNKAIILNDETISDSPNGGSGKGIIINSIGHMKKLSTIDGKTFDFNKSFAFQTVNTDTQVLAFDDVKKSFEFERLFSVITEGITIEYKGKDAIKIPIQDSPKILISTNYTIKAEGGSFQRRIFEVEMSSYFGANYTPLDQFGNLLFDEWDDIQWQLFDKFMINCIQYYLENGLVASSAKNLATRKFINETSQEFYEYTITEKQLESGIRINKIDFLNKYYEEYPDSKKWVTNRIIVKWVKKYCDYIKTDYAEGNSNSKRWFIIGENAEVMEEEVCPY